ncbi:MAG: polyhydroxyalkanoic acid system family protein [Burkholderiales bacterium]|nr:polyhydroxyalkanoic acid system family protein [Burkholderiales bacterium]
MADIKIERAHALGLEKARLLAQEWMDDAAKKLGLTCKLKPGETQDVIKFERMGVTGKMTVSPDAFKLEARLGMMMAAFKPMVEAEIDKNLSHILARAEGGAPSA